MCDYLVAHTAGLLTWIMLKRMNMLILEWAGSRIPVHLIRSHTADLRKGEYGELYIYREGTSN